VPKTEYEKIATRAAKGETQKQIAADYKVNRSQISNILKKYKRQKEI
jgi:uncharacterized protein (DUF433 family)